MRAFAWALLLIALLPASAEAGWKWSKKQRKQIATNASGERLLAIPLLARRYPRAKVVYAGGHGTLLGERLANWYEIPYFNAMLGVADDLPPEEEVVEARQPGGNGGAGKGAQGAARNASGHDLRRNRTRVNNPGTPAQLYAALRANEELRSTLQRMRLLDRLGGASSSGFRSRP